MGEYNESHHPFARSRTEVIKTPTHERLGQTLKSAGSAVLTLVRGTVEPVEQHLPSN